MIRSSDIANEIIQDFGPVYFQSFMTELRNSMLMIEYFEETIVNHMQTNLNNYLAPLSNISIAIH